VIIGLAQKRGRPIPLAGLVFFGNAASADEDNSMWKRFAACLAAVALFVVLSGCSGDKETGKYKNQDKPKSTEEQ
jgi:hypothetical protein